MYIALVILQVLVALALITLVLIQHGKGADAGAAFGSGASGTLFGARGSANFLSRTTGWLAAAFFAISLALAYAVHGQSGGTGSIVDELPAATTPVSSASVAKPAAAPVLPAESTSAAKPATGETPAPKVPD